MKIWAGLFLIILGIFIGVYLGVWLCLVGGIIQVVEALRFTDINALSVFVGIVRIILAPFVGWLSFGLLFVIGIITIKS